MLFLLNFQFLLNRFLKCLFFQLMILAVVLVYLASIFLKKNLILLPITCLATSDISNILLALKASHNNKKEPYFSVYPAFSIFSFLKALWVILLIRSKAFYPHNDNYGLLAYWNAGLHTSLETLFLDITFLYYTKKIIYLYNIFTFLCYYTNKHFHFLCMSSSCSRWIYINYINKF